MARPKNPENPTTRSFRVSTRAWEAAKKRAAREGTTMSSATGDLVEGYAQGIYNLPEKRVVREFPSPEQAHNPQTDV